MALEPHRRWIVLNAIANTAAINLVLNALPAWPPSAPSPAPAARGGVVTTSLLAGPAAGALALSAPNGLGSSAFVIYKTALGVGIGLLVTPLIALRAMGDPVAVR